MYLAEVNKMKKIKVDVIIHWVDKNQNGKINLPSKIPYYVITEPIVDSLGKKISWSLILEIDSNSNSDKEVNRIGLGKASFLVESAPSDLLIKGHSLKVYEGQKFVATIEVI